MREWYRTDTAAVDQETLGADQLAALIMALHRCAQRSLPVAMFGAGLPQLPGQLGRAKSYAERLFEFPVVGPLDPGAAADAIRKPIAAESTRIDARPSRASSR